MSGGARAPPLRLRPRPSSAKPRGVKLRRLLPLLTLLAMIVAPFGRVAAAEAMSTAHQPAAMAGHCQDMPAPDEDRGSGQSEIDCLVACAAIAAPEAVALAGRVPTAAPRAGSLPRVFAGLHPEADPPPPRFS